MKVQNLIAMTVAVVLAAGVVGCSSSGDKCSGKLLQSPSGRTICSDDLPEQPVVSRDNNQVVPEDSAPVGQDSQGLNEEPAQNQGEVSESTNEGSQDQGDEARDPDIHLNVPLNIPGHVPQVTPPLRLLDRTSPSVVYVNIADGATITPDRHVISIRFSEEIDPATVNERTILVVPAGGRAAIPGTVSSTGPTTAKFEAQVDFPAPAEITLVISGVKDLAGNLNAFFIEHFTTTP